MKLPSVSCIIPAYNEAERIGIVLQAVANHPLISEVIVIDDGSSDNTSELVREFKNIRLIQHEKNRGKSAAMATGIEASQGDYICALDADLLGITQDSISRLIWPVLAKEVEQTISLRSVISPWRLIDFDMLSGERVFPKAFLATHLETLRELQGFGLEAFMDGLIVEQHIPVMSVFLPGVENTRKFGKYGWKSGARAYLQMFREIHRTVPASEWIGRIYRLDQLRVPEKTVSWKVWFFWGIMLGLLAGSLITIRLVDIYYAHGELFERLSMFI